MVSIASLWLPILLSAVIVFAVSSIIHMLLPYHRNDLGKLPDEDKVMDALRKYRMAPGDYMIPCAGSLKAAGAPEFISKMKRGPVALMTVMKSGTPSMVTSLAWWFIYSVVVGIFAAYIAGRALGAGSHYLAVFRFAGCTAFVGYTLALWQNVIWYKRSWKATLKSTLDGLLYGLLTGGTFGWLWPS